jgi:hypothetical protein
MSNNELKVFHTASFSSRSNLTILGAHCRYLINNLNKKTYKSHIAEIAQLETQYESEIVEIYVLKSLVSHIDWSDSKRQKDQYKLQLLASRVSNILLLQPNFASTICEGLDGVPLTDDFINIFSSTLKLTHIQEITLALGMTKSFNERLNKLGLEFLRKNLLSLLTQQPASQDKLPDYIVHDLLFFLRERDSEFPEKEPIIEFFRKNYGSALTFIPLTNSCPTRNDAKRNWKKESKTRLAPFLQDIETSFSPADLMEDLGFVCCSNFKNLKTVLSQFNLPLSPSTVAEIIGMMVRTHQLSSDDKVPVILYTDYKELIEEPVTSRAWNIDVFVSAIHDLCPDLNCVSVIEHLDYPDFRIYDQEGLHVLVEFFKKMKTNLQFPVDVLFKKWKNIDSQLSLLVNATLSNAIEFAPTPSLTSVTQDLIDMSNPVLSNMHCVPLVTTLLRLSSESVGFYADINEIFQKTIQWSPYLLLLVLSVIHNQKLANCPLKSELMKQLSELFVSPSNALSTKVVSYIWQIDSSIVQNAIQESYVKDPSILPTIFDLIQELKILRPVIDNCATTNFSIDLAALAALRDHLNLERWLEEMTTKYGNQFNSACISFLRERIIQQQQLPSLVTSATTGHKTDLTKQNEQSKFVILTYETVQLFMEQLRNVVNEGKMSPEVQEDLRQLTTTLESEVFPSDIEKEANVIFSRIYDGLMTIEEIINLLQLLKISNNQRERKIFQCIIRSLRRVSSHS